MRGPGWDVVLTNRARKDLKKLDAQTADRVADKLERLADTGHGDVKRLTGQKPPEWRLRVGDWRVRFAYAPDARELVVLRVRHRSKAYD